MRGCFTSVLPECPEKQAGEEIGIRQEAVPDDGVGGRVHHGSYERGGNGRVEVEPVGVRGEHLGDGRDEPLPFVQVRGAVAPVAGMVVVGGMRVVFGVRVRRVPGFVFTLIGLFDPVIRASREMAYLWRVPHRLIDRRLETVAGPLPATPLPKAMASIAD